MKLITYYKQGLIFIIKSPLIFIKYFLTGIKALLITLPITLVERITFFFKQEKSPKKIFSISIFTLSLTTYLISIFILTRWYVQTERNKKFITSLTEESILITDDTLEINQYNDSNINTTTPIINNNNPSNNSNNISNNTYIPNYININLNYYINKNKDTVGWIKIDDTKINYPILKTSNNTYYLEHDFYKKKTSIGSIYADYRNNFNTFDNNTIIYGHNLVDYYMFGALPTFLNKSWLNKPEQHYIKISTQTTNSIWQIFSVYKIAPTADYLQTKFYSMDTYNNFLTTIKNRSIHNLNIPLDYTDKIITLSTCDNTGKNRVVIHAKLINIKEK